MANDMAKRLLARIRTRREAKGLTQEAFAEKAGLGYKYYQSVEAGRKRDIRLSTLEKLSKALELELWQLLNFEFMPPVVSEEAAKSGGRATVGKVPRKPIKRRSGGKG